VALQSYLAQQEYCLVWLTLGEKEVIGGHFGLPDNYGRSDFSGLMALDGDTVRLCGQQLYYVAPGESRLDDDVPAPETMEAPTELKVHITVTDPSAGGNGST
jgi:hypothetical protein